MSVVSIIQSAVTNALEKLFQQTFTGKDFQVNITKPEFEGDYTVVLFNLLKPLRQSPDGLGKTLGEYLIKEHADTFLAYNVIKGFLNLSIADSFWQQFLHKNYDAAKFGYATRNNKKIVVEYASPNTNKPLHLGHLRNIFLGWSISEILDAAGYDVVKTCIANDRGIHICKSMVAWQLFANGATPESTGSKGDHLVGNYYVMFGNELKKQAKPILEAIYANKKEDELFSEAEESVLQKHISKKSELENILQEAVGKFNWINTENAPLDNLVAASKTGQGKWKEVLKLLQAEDNADLLNKVKQADKQIPSQLKSFVSLEEKIETENAEVKDFAENKTPLMKAAKQMLVDWEAGKPEVMELWKTMNGWVYSGFDVTYKRIGINFDKMYYESDTYLLGKQLVEEGLQKNVFYQKEDSSVWVDLTADGLDEKIVQRKDGTAVYITQDIGLAVNKYEEFKYDSSIYVVGDEQNYHFKVLKLICEKLGLPSSEGIYHLSYGMVELPTGRMKTREGTVVDADDIMDEMVAVARQKTEELGKVNDFTADELLKLYNTIGLGALKFFILRVDPKKRMIFNPEESIDFHGFTASFVQFSHARAKAILRNEAVNAAYNFAGPGVLFPLEKELIILLEQYPAIIQQAAAEHNPSSVVNYCYSLAKTFNSFVTEHRVLKAESEDKKQLRLQLCQMTAAVIASGMKLSGIQVPERM